MAQGHAFHRNQVQAGFNVGGHATAEKIKNNAPCGSRLPVPRANGRSGIYNDGGQAVADRGQHFLLGKVLGTLVMPDHLLQPRFRPLIGQTPRPRNCQRRHTARVDKFLDLRLGARFQQIASSSYVTLVNLLRVSRPKAVVRRHVKNALHTANRGCHGGWIAQVTVHASDGQPHERACVTLGADEHAHRVTVVQQHAGDMATQKSVRAGYEGDHFALLAASATR